MPSSCRNSNRSRKSATESIPPDTATPTRSPAFSNSCRRIRNRKRSARECTATWYRTAHVGTAAFGRPAERSGSTMHSWASWRSPDRRRGGCSHMNLNARALLRDQLLDLLHEIRGRHVFRLFLSPRAHIHLARLSLF